MKASRSYTIDKSLIEVSVELLGNCSIHAGNGLLQGVLNKLDTMKDEHAKPYRDKLSHLIKG